MTWIANRGKPLMPCAATCWARTPHTRLRRSLCETAALADHLDRRLLTLAGEPYNHPRGEVQRARIVLQETAK